MVDQLHDISNRTKPAELRLGTHARASLAAKLKGVKLVDFVSQAADRAARPVLRKHGILNGSSSPD